MSPRSRTPFWNQGENLDPTRLRAQQTLLLPQEELTLHVHTRLFRMGIFLGDAFVKEFRVGADIGKPRVAYRQTLAGTATVEGRHVKQSGGHGQFAVCELVVEPQQSGASGSNVEFENEIVGGTSPSSLWQ